jgi:hypothetical protein
MFLAIITTGKTFAGPDATWEEFGVTANCEDYVLENKVMCEPVVRVEGNPHSINYGQLYFTFVLINGDKFFKKPEIKRHKIYFHQFRPVRGGWNYRFYFTRVPDIKKPIVKVYIN